MRPAPILLAIALMVAACGETSNQVHASPTPELFGTATLSDTRCDFAMPQQVPKGVLKFRVVNHASFDGRFMLVRIHDGHTFQELIYPANALPPTFRQGMPNIFARVAAEVAMSSSATAS